MHTLNRSRCLNYLSTRRKAVLILGTAHMKGKSRHKDMPNTVMQQRILSRTREPWPEVSQVFAAAAWAAELKTQRFAATRRKVSRL